MTTILNIVAGLVNTMGVTVLRCDIQYHNNVKGMEGYTAFVDLEKDGIELDILAIHEDGSMEFIKH